MQQAELRRPADDLLLLLSQRLNRRIDELTKPYQTVLSGSSVQSFRAKASKTWVDFLHAQDIVRTLVAAREKKFEFNPELQKFRKYAPQDPQYQLKLLKMHSIHGLEQGFFKRIDPRIPDLASSLASMRNMHCHFEEHEPDQLLRSIDKAGKLLTALGDPEGAHQVQTLLDDYAVLLGLARAEDYQKPQLAPEVQREIDKEKEKNRSTEKVTHKEAPSRQEAEKIDDLLTEEAPPVHAEDYAPWEVEPLGQPDHLNRIRARGHAQRVRNAITEIVEAEAPISLERLIRLTAYAFGIATLTKTMRTRIRNQVLSTESLYLDEYKFVWPDEETWETYFLFRVDPEGYQRPMEEISPKELANAIRYHRTQADKSEDELREVLAYFNRSRRTQPVRKQLALAYEELGEGNPCE